jgi:glutathione S-transferase
VKLYDLDGGMNPRRVRIFLAEKGVEIPIEVVDMTRGENNTPEFLAKNAMGKLPVLELDDGTCITESVAICRYIESLHPEPNMFGINPLETAHIEMWTRRTELNFAIPILQVFEHLHPFWEGRTKQVKECGELAREKTLTRLAWLDEELGKRATEDRAFLAAGRYTVADITLQSALIVAKACRVRIPEELAHLTQWFASVTARPTARA